MHPATKRFTIMPDEIMVPDAASLEADLVGQVFQDEDRQPEAKPEGEEKAEETTSDAEKVSTDENKEDDSGTATPDGETKEETPADGQQKTVKLGNREFQSTEEAFKEAERLVGHNANLAHELIEFKTKADEAAKQLAEAMEANKQWSEWAEANAKGESKEAPGAKVEDVVRKVLQEKEAIEQNKTLEVKLKEEIGQLEKLGNFNDALPTLKELSSKVNPSTGKYFTPIEAYKYACWQLGITNELEKKEVSKPVSPASGALKAATRPTSGTTSAPSKNDDIDEVSEILSQYY